MTKGKLYMLPVPIAEGPIELFLPQSTIEVARKTRFFLAENAKSARHFLKSIEHPEKIVSLSITEIGHRPETEKIRQWLAPIYEGNDIAIISEAGCPGIADPGAQIVSAAQELDIEVLPLVGPSSILLGLMASGMDGQNFRFCGYLPIKEPERTLMIKKLEQQSSFHRGESELFIETPYRNQKLFDDLLTHLNHETKLLVACDILGPKQSIKTKRVADWKKHPLVLPKLPTIFGLQAFGKKKSCNS